MLSKSEVAVSHIGHVTHGRSTLRSAMHDVLMGYQNDTVVRFDRDKCLVCGEYHNHGNLPCPTMQVTAHVQIG